MSFNFQSHNPVMQEGQLVGYRLTPYISVLIGDIAIHVQSGQFWGSGGISIAPEDVPSDVWDAVEKWSDATKLSVGMDKVKRPGGASSKKAA